MTLYCGGYVGGRVSVSFRPQVTDIQDPKTSRSLGIGDTPQRSLFGGLFPKRYGHITRIIIHSMMNTQSPNSMSVVSHLADTPGRPPGPTLSTVIDKHTTIIMYA